MLNELSGLTGALPDSLMSVSAMKNLQLFQTQLTAPIFDFVPSWPELEILWLDQSHVTGSIPTTIGVTNPKLKEM